MPFTLVLSGVWLFHIPRLSLFSGSLLSLSFHFTLHMASLCFSRYDCAIGGASASNHEPKCRDLPPLTVVQHIQGYRNRLDGRCFAPMRFAGDNKETSDVRS